MKNGFSPGKLYYSPSMIGCLALMHLIANQKCVRAWCKSWHETPNRGYFYLNCCLMGQPTNMQDPARLANSNMLLAMSNSRLRSSKAATRYNRSKLNHTQPHTFSVSAGPFYSWPVEGERQKETLNIFVHLPNNEQPKKMRLLRVCVSESHFVLGTPDPKCMYCVVIETSMKEVKKKSFWCH